MKVLVTGLPLFSKRLTVDLNSQVGKKEFLFLDTYNSKWAQLRFLLLLPFSSGVFSMNGVSNHSGLLNWVLRFRKKLWMQWVGTDVSIAIEGIEKKTINRNYINYAKHATDASWLKEELDGIGIHCTLNCYKYLPSDQVPVQQYEQIQVCSYVPQERQVFYGLPEIVKLAEAFPSIPFHIYGMTTPDLPAPENMIFYGWQPEELLQAKMKESALFLRLTEHDGFSVSVVEAMSLGSEVLTYHPFPLVNCVQDTDLLTIFTHAVAQVENRGMTPNLVASKYYKTHFNRERVFEQLYRELKTYFGK
jgi:hypothetical protein